MEFNIVRVWAFLIMIVALFMIFKTHKYSDNERIKWIKERLKKDWNLSKEENKEYTDVINFAKYNEILAILIIIIANVILIFT